jgi:altronate dehydratase
LSLDPELVARVPTRAHTSVVLSVFRSLRARSFSTASASALRQSAESNPSGGNNFRGLYNIGLKSLGAAKKKHAEVRVCCLLLSDTH